MVSSTLRVVCIAVSLLAVGASPAPDRPRIRITLSPPHFIPSNVNGYANQDLYVQAGGAGGPWMVVEVDGPTYSATVKPTPDHTQLLRYPGLIVGEYEVRGSIRDDQDHILAMDKAHVVVQ